MSNRRRLWSAWSATQSRSSIFEDLVGELILTVESLRRAVDDHDPQRRLRRAASRHLMSMQVFTLATQPTLPQARVLARSLRRHQPDWPLDIVLVGAGSEPTGSARSEESVPYALPLMQLDLDVELLIARHEEEDLVALLLPHCCSTLRRARRRRGAAPTAERLGSRSLEPIELALSRARRAARAEDDR